MKITLVEVSPGVTFPAYPQTDIALRSMTAWQETLAASSAESLQHAADMVQIDLKRRRLRLRELAS